MSDYQAAAEAAALTLNADVAFLCGEITRNVAVEAERILSSRRRREKVLLILVTQGGDPDAAFRIARAFQNYYKNVCCFIPGWCKSAGTLISLSASTIFMGDLGEIGPLDIQVPKQDEFDEAASGLLIDSTMRTLENTASRMFINFLKGIRKDTGVTTKMAAELAVKMVVGMMGPVFSQVEPLRMGENARAMNITKAYGFRLNMVSKSLPSQTHLDYLVGAYPDHGFVIDRKEAQTIFSDVRKPTLELHALAEAMGKEALYPPGQRDQARITYLSSEYAQPKDAPQDGALDVQSPTKSAGGGAGRRSRPAMPTGARAKRSSRDTNGHARSSS